MKEYLVYLKLQPYRHKTLGHRYSQKLASKYYGPYKVLARIGTVAYKLQLPTSYLQAILERRMVKKNLQAATQLLIHWAGLTPAEATWEFADEIALRFPQFDLEDKVHLMKGQLLQANI